MVAKSGTGRCLLDRGKKGKTQISTLSHLCQTRRSSWNSYPLAVLQAEFADCPIILDRGWQICTSRERTALSPLLSSPRVHRLSSLQHLLLRALRSSQSEDRALQLFGTCPEFKQKTTCYEAVASLTCYRISSDASPALEEPGHSEQRWTQTASSKLRSSTCVTSSSPTFDA